MLSCLGSIHQTVATHVQESTNQKVKPTKLTTVSGEKPKPNENRK